jgi:hypothetical protein
VTRTVVIPVDSTGAVRSTGSLLRVALMRVLVVGGLTASAWLLSDAVASADTGTPAGTANGSGHAAAPAPRHHRHASAESLLAALLSEHKPWESALDAASDARTLGESDAQPCGAPARQPADTSPTRPWSAPAEDGYSGSGGTSGGTRSGSVSNTVPQPLLAERIAEKQARKAAEQAAAASPPPVVQAPPPVLESPVVTKALIRKPVRVAPSAAQLGASAAANHSDLGWSSSQHHLPMPAPQPAPAPAAPSASTGGFDNSGGARGALVVLTSQSASQPPATWSVEHRTDGRAPGSLPGLPSTSPD